MFWEIFKGAIKGTLVKGDKDVPPTGGSLQHLRLLLFVWKTVAVFRVSESDAEKGYRIGFIPQSGQAMVNKKLRHKSHFRVRVGHEDCTFFVVNSMGKELPMEMIARSTKKDPAYKHWPLC